MEHFFSPKMERLHRRKTFHFLERCKMFHFPKKKWNIKHGHVKHGTFCIAKNFYGMYVYFPPYYNDNSTSVLFINKMHVLSTTTIQVRTYLPTYLSTSLPIYLTAMHLRYISGLKSHQFTLKILKSLEDVHTYSCPPFSLSLYHSLSIRPIIPTMC